MAHVMGTVIIGTGISFGDILVTVWIIHMVDKFSEKFDVDNCTVRYYIKKA